MMTLQVNRKCLVIWNDGNAYQAIICETEYPDSSMPHMFGLPDDADIVAVVAGFNPVNSVVYIDEEEIIPSATSPDSDQRR